MYLKEIRAQGFKSFADKTIIELNNGITGIVGPNGSGKSNVVDAVRWVLGEQSVKSLRGEGNMSDVIFSGSKSRKELNVAQVTLVFDNTDHYINSDYNEISIKRRVYKDGTNEYYLNNEKVRLKDITDLLIDSGMAKESFNIISQGKIEEILSNKPENRRIIFEEAAGVLKYKKRKEEALRKLEKTHDNISRIDDIIKELEIQIGPLKEQKEKAIKYLELKDELKNIEIALIINDITNINRTYQLLKDDIDKLNIELDKIISKDSVKESKIEEYKLELSKLEEKIKLKNNELLDITSKVLKTESNKQMILERQKYNSNDTKLHTNLVDLKEKQKMLENETNILNNEFINIDKELEQKKIKVDNVSKEIESIKLEKQNIELELSKKNRLELLNNNKIDSLKNEIDNNTLLPNSVKKVLDNPKLKGIHNVIGHIIEMDSTYSISISTSLGFSISNIIVDDSKSAKDAVNYLKNNDIGRATFFPLDVIKPRSVDIGTLEIVKKQEGFIDIASNLVKYDKIYSNVILNQLGNVLIVDNIDNANKISKLINNTYKIVTLDGQVINVGGSITGGNQIKTKNIISSKYELEKLIFENKNILNEISVLEDRVNIVDSKIKEYEDKLYLLNKELIKEEEIKENKNKQLLSLNSNKESLELEIRSLTSVINGELTKEEENIINEFYNLSKEKDNITNEYNNLLKEKDNLKDELELLEREIKKENSLYNELNNSLKNKEIELNRMDVKLDTLLNNLNENYSITYENAISIYHLDLEVNIARNKVNSIKRDIKELGDVNVLAKDEFDKVNERYEYLLNGREDLTKAENTLLEIISEMDLVMEKEFLSSFKVIEKNFCQTFKELFHGGDASLKLTDPNNINETGIEIIACPPGKKLTTIQLLSGGEKTFTAISLLFAIIKSKPNPFCILDEVEAALDDANVSAFGKYLRNLKEKTQFIVITHKKKTMEYVDLLYGITMQESGVSKLVSVELENIK